MTYISLKTWDLRYLCEWPIDKQTTHYAYWNAEPEIVLAIYITLPTQHTHLYQHLQNNDHFAKIMSQ